MPLWVLRLISGLSYGFNSPLTERWIKEHNVPSMLSPNAPLSAYLFPLLFEPGTHFRYSVGIDWAGFLVSRVTGLSLEDYFQKHIFQPSGIEHMSFHPPKDYAERRMGMLVRPKPDGALLHTGEQPLPRTFVAAEIGPHYSGGGGLFGTARDYLRFLRAILASADPNTANPLISTASFRTLFTDTLPQDHRETMREELVVMAKGQNIHDPALLASGKGENIGHSPGLFLNYVESKFGRSAMSGCWDGAAKTMYWLDPAKGIAVSRSAHRHGTQLTTGRVLYEPAGSEPGPMEQSLQRFRAARVRPSGLMTWGLDGTNTARKTEK